MLLSVVLSILAIGATTSQARICHLVSLPFNGRMVWALELEGSSECTQIGIGGYSSLELLSGELLVFDEPYKLLAAEDVQKVLNKMHKRSMKFSTPTNRLSVTKDKGSHGCPDNDLWLIISTPDKATSPALYNQQGSSSNFKQHPTRNDFTTKPRMSSDKLFTSINSREETTLAGDDADAGMTTTAPLKCSVLLEYDTGTTQNYRYLDVLADTDLIKFEAKASNDVHIALSPCETSSEFYEIVIGGWSNKKSVIRRCGQCAPRVTVRTVHYLSPDEFRTFWIIFGNNGTIGVGRNNEMMPFMEWTDPDPLEVQYLGYSTGYGSSGQFRFCNFG